MASCSASGARPARMSCAVRAASTAAKSHVPTTPRTKKAVPSVTVAIWKKLAKIVKWTSAFAVWPL